MKNNEVLPGLKGRKFKGHITKIKRIRTEPRQRIRQLLRSFEPLELPGRRPDSR
ncbi:hypothetical protein FHW88_003381 [Mucilaginibacter sp. SG538B]|uniref:hypothetical protein n=1 Tax=Mucilaginibacter sp. SG538B TaxID=2587021 RepID=UPI00159E5927|nr:hypothetical protein [Mucilaginibacter sp. SG538B]NVM65077.1 hypothetical protein [Mucilaginibacter sp. SG538B]